MPVWVAASTLVPMIQQLMANTDTARVLAASAALQLDLRNLNELLLLEKLSLYAAQQPTEPGRPLSSSALKRLLGAPEVGGLAMLEQLDPFEGLPVHDVLVPPDRFLVLDGQATNGVAVVERLLRAVFANRGRKFPHSYTTRVWCATRFLLGLSDTLCRRFDRSVHERPPPLTRKVFVPAAAKLAELSARVTFTREELFAGFTGRQVEFLSRAFLQRHGDLAAEPPAGRDTQSDDGSPGRSDAADAPNCSSTRPPAAHLSPGFEQLAAESGLNPQALLGPDGPSDGDGVLAVRPLFETHLGIVIAAPTALAATLRHFIIVDAMDHECLQELVLALTDTGVDDVRFWLEGMADAEFVHITPESPSDMATPGEWIENVASGCAARLVAPFDGNKMLDVRIVVDDLRDYDPMTIWGTCWARPLSLPALGHPAEKTLIVTLQVNVGRGLALVSERTSSPWFAGTLEDLVTVLTTPRTDRMTLWYFADAYRRLTEHTDVMTTSVIDVFSMFRENRDSFYLTDDRQPQAISVEVASGQALRVEAALTVGSPQVLFGQGVARATGVHGPTSPVATVVMDSRFCFAHLDRLTIWARCRVPTSTGSDPKSPTYERSEVPLGPQMFDEFDGPFLGIEHQLAQSITYWLWQIYRVAPALFPDLDRRTDLFVDGVLALGPAGDTSPGGNDPAIAGAVLSRAARADWVQPPEVFDVDPVSDGREVVGFHLLLHPPSAPDNDEAPNSRDRLLVSALIDGLAELRVRTGPSSRGEAQTDPRSLDWQRSLVDAVAPSGYKQLTQITTTDDPLIYWPGNLPTAVRVHPSAIAQVLDALIDHFAGLTRPPGAIPDTERTRFLNEEVTAFFIEWLTEEVQQLDAAAALPVLTVLYEALIHETAIEAMRLPSQIACFGEDSSSVQELRANRVRANESAISIRFLLEFVSALRPTGSAPVTRELTDLLIAIASEIINKGYLSDLIKFGIADSRLAVLNSGRLGIERGEFYTEASEAFSDALSSTQLQQALNLSRIHSHTEAPVTQGDNPAAEPVTPKHDELAKAEYGFTYTQLTAACGALLDASVQAGQVDLGVLEEPKALEVVRTATDLDVKQAQAMLDMLTLAPMVDFWAASVDVYPWRFNRDRSYLRRPLVRGPRPHRFIGAEEPHLTNGTASSGSDDDPVLMFGHRNLFLTPQHWYIRHVSGRLPARTGVMRSAMAAARRAKGDAFEERVAQQAREAGATSVRRNVRRIGSLNLRNVEGRDVGDVDVLVATCRGDVLVIEAKALELARTPRELANEMRNLYEGDGSAIERAVQRATILREHRSEVEALLGLEPHPGRAFTPIVVTDQALLGGYLNQSSVPIVAIDKLATLIRVGKS